MIEIRVRDEFHADAVRLCDWPADKLDSVIPTIQRWGLRTEDDEADSSMEKEVTGSVVYDPTRGEAYFEVLIEVAG